VQGVRGVLKSSFEDWAGLSAVAFEHFSSGRWLHPFEAFERTFEVFVVFEVLVLGCNGPEDSARKSGISKALK
jgi:hypothetical protein